MVLHYTGGATWSVMGSGTTESLQGIWGSGAGDVYAVGYKGTVIHHAGTGLGWTTQASVTAETLRDVWGSGPTDVFAVGDDGTIIHGAP